MHRLAVAILHRASSRLHCSTFRSLSTTPHLKGPKPLPPRPIIDSNSITESFLKGSGPGGQKINKTSSAVQLIHHPTGIVVKCQETRSRSQNRKIARKLLGERIEEVELGPEARTVVKRERESKKKASKDKKARRKYRALAAQGDKAGEEGDDGGEEGGSGEEGGLREGEMGSGDITKGVSDVDPKLENKVEGVDESHTTTEHKNEET